jgi:hypothetical protein
MAALSPAFGCGLMLRNLPRFNASDPLRNAMANYGYENLSADKAAQKILENSGLLKQFYDGAFASKTPLRQNYRNVYGHHEVLMAIDATAKAAWFVADPANRMALVNYYRDALGLSLKPLGVSLLGSTVRLTPGGWQNLYDLLSDKFFTAHPGIKRIEILGLDSGARCRAGTLGVGASMLNLREFPEVTATVGATLSSAT